jgi:hypothetical protein
LLNDLGKTTYDFFLESMHALPNPIQPSTLHAKRGIGDEKDMLASIVGLCGFAEYRCGHG